MMVVMAKIKISFVSSTTRPKIMDKIITDFISHQEAEHSVLEPIDSVENITINLRHPMHLVWIIPNNAIYLII